MPHRPLVLSAPEPRSLDLIFTTQQRANLDAQFRIHECSAENVVALPPDLLAEVRYIIGQPPLDDATLAALRNVRCIFNVESTLINNRP